MVLARGAVYRHTHRDMRISHGVVLDQVNLAAVNGVPGGSLLGIALRYRVSRSLGHSSESAGLTASTYRSLACKVVVVLFLLFVALPIAEIYALIKMGSWLGLFPTLAVLVLISAVGAALVKREGLRVFRRFQEQIAAGNMPTNEMVDGVCLLIAGVLLVVPGFVTDALGLFLLLPPFRMLLRRRLKKSSGKKVNIVATYNGHIVETNGVINVTENNNPPKEIEP
jgi:UPF0716 protein FxsA